MRQCWVIVLCCRLGDMKKVIITKETAVLTHTFAKE